MGEVFFHARLVLTACVKLAAPLCNLEFFFFLIVSLSFSLPVSFPPAACHLFM